MKAMKESSGKRGIYLVLGRSRKDVSSLMPRVPRELALLEVEDEAGSFGCEWGDLTLGLPIYRHQRLT